MRSKGVPICDTRHLFAVVLMLITTACAHLEAGAAAPCERGVGLALMGKVQEAEAVFQGILASDPRNPCALSNLGNLRAIADRPGEALAFYDQAILSDSLDAGILLNRAMVRAYLKDSLGAGADMRRGLELAGTLDSAAWLLGTRLDEDDSGVRGAEVGEGILRVLASRARIVEGLRAAYKQLEARGDTVTKGASGDVSIPSLALYWNKETKDIVTVFYATDRAPSGQPGTFGSERGELTFGQCTVSVPRDHKMGALESPSWWRLQWSPDPKQHVVLKEVTPLTKATFTSAVSSLATLERDSSAIVFVHGYNVSFEEAARRTAQITYDLGFHGAPIFYSWPSRASASAYLADEANVEWTQPHLEQFLRELLTTTPAAHIYLLGHSMGSRALSRAVVNVCASDPTLSRRIRELILSAPDMDADVFKQEIAPKLIGRCATTLYASATDKALEASRVIHGGHARAGDAGAGLVLLPGIETIDASNVDTDFLGHCYFADVRSVIADIFSLIRDRKRAAERFALLGIERNGTTYWAFKK